MSMSRLRGAVLLSLGLAALPAAAGEHPPLLYTEVQPAVQEWHEEAQPPRRRRVARRVSAAPGEWPERPTQNRTVVSASNDDWTETVIPDALINEAAEAASTPLPIVPAPTDATLNAPSAPPSPPPALVAPVPAQEPWRAETFAPPTPEAVENYRRRLEIRLLEKYNNTPQYAGKVARVAVILSKPLEHSVDGSLIKADFDQLVYDLWGKRIPALEKEYFVVTFGDGGVRQVRSDPSIRVGLDLENAYSERAPLAADPFRNAPDAESFAPAPEVKMPAWWRPDFPELK